MADDADRAGELIERTEAARISAAKVPQPTLIPTGVCYWCASDIPPGHTFCDSDCRDDWDHHRRRRKELGQ